MPQRVQEPVLSRLSTLGLQLPPPPAPAGQYLPVVRAGSLLYVSAQFPFVAGRLEHTGQVGREVSVAQGRDAAAAAALNVLSQLHAALGSFEQLKSLVFVEGHVASAPTFNDQPGVLDGASGLFHAVLGEMARHARAAFAPARLPFDAPVILVVTAEARD